MAISPMQRKSRNSFLLGMLLMLVIAAIVVAILFMQILGMKKEEAQVDSQSKVVFMLSRDIKSGENITAADVKSVKVVTDMSTDNIATSSDMSDATIARIDLPKGAILSNSMITTTDEKVTNDLRVQEYNMIVLPTDLSKNDYVDIRILFPNSQDYIVVSKKRILQSSSNTIFIKMTEEEILTMSNAIVEAYQVDGAMIYATKYEDPGSQTAATPTFPVSRETLGVINANPNIVNEAKQALWARYNQEAQDRRTEINNVLSANADGATEKIKSKIDEQIEKQAEERARYIETLGTGADY